jgi:hypothetical protein
MVSKLVEPRAALPHIASKDLKANLDKRECLSALAAVFKQRCDTLCLNFLPKADC